MKHISKLIPLIGVVLFIYVLVNIGVEKIAHAFLSVPPQFYLLSLLIFVPRMLLFVYKWKFVSKKQKLEFSFSYLAEVFLISLFYGSLTPGTIGWHVRIYYLKKKSQASLGKCIANSLLDSASSFIAGLFLSLIGALLLIERIPGLFLPVLIFLVFNVVILVVFLKKERGNKFFKLFIKPFIPMKYKDTVDSSVESLYEDLPKGRDVIVAIMIELMIWVIGATQVYAIALAFSVDIPYVLFILISIISTIVASFPISIGGLGVREGTLVFLLGLFGVQPQIAFVISLSGFLIKSLIPGIVGWLVSLRQGIGIGDFTDIL